MYRHRPSAKVTATIILCVAAIVLHSQPAPNAPRINATLNDVPRVKPGFDKTGFYEMGVSINKSELNPGDEFKANVFFTGYGKIGLSKVAVIPSQIEIFDTTESSILTSLGDDGQKFYWGSKTYPFVDGYIIGLTGGMVYKSKDSSYYDNYIDANSDPRDLLILTELRAPNAPVTLNLKLVHNIEPGNYRINFYYTYFNGVQWSGSTQSVEFKVNNLLEQYPLMFTVLGLVIGFVSILPLFSQGIAFLFKRKSAPAEPKHNLIKPAIKKTGGRNS